MVNVIISAARRPCPFRAAEEHCRKLLLLRALLRELRHAESVKPSSNIPTQEVPT
jgi:hypothetical protein